MELVRFSYIIIVLGVDLKIFYNCFILEPIRRVRIKFVYTTRESGTHLQTIDGVLRPQIVSCS